MKYVYRKPHVRAAMWAYDLFGRVFFRRRAPRISGPPKSVAFLVLHQIGDAVMALPTIQAVRQALPNARVDVFLGSVSEPLLRPSLDGCTIHTFDAGWDATVRGSVEAAEGTEVRLGSKIMEINPEVALVFFPDVHVNRVLGTARVPHSYGFGNAGGGFWLTHPMSAPGQGHQVERNFALARRLGEDFGVEVGEPLPPQLVVDMGASSEVDAMVRDLVASNRPGGSTTRTHTGEDAFVTSNRLAVLHPFARFSSRSWRAERWSQVIEWLASSGYLPVIIGGPHDDATQWRAASLAGKLSLAQTAALLSKSELFIGIDSGPGHIAAAVGCPVVSIFSAANVPEQWAPFGSNVEVVYHDIADRTRWSLEMRNLPEGTEGNPYTDAITVDEVIAAARRVTSADA